MGKKAVHTTAFLEDGFLRLLLFLGTFSDNYNIYILRDFYGMNYFYLLKTSSYSSNVLLLKVSSDTSFLRYENSACLGHEIMNHES